MGYFNMSIGNITDDVLIENVGKAANKVMLGLTTFDKEIEIRLHEIETINMMTSHKSRTIKNNKRRIEYINKEIDELIKLKENK